MDGLIQFCTPSNEVGCLNSVRFESTLNDDDPYQTIREYLFHLHEPKI